MGDGWKRAIKAAENSRIVSRQVRIQRLGLTEGSRVVWNGQAATVKTISARGMVTIEHPREVKGKTRRRVDPNSLGILAG
jgi:hypothetical protein